MSIRTATIYFVFAITIGTACGDGDKSAPVNQETSALTAGPIVNGLPVDMSTPQRGPATDALKTLPLPGPARRATAAERKAIEAAIAAQKANPRQFQD